LGGAASASIVIAREVRRAKLRIIRSLAEAWCRLVARNAFCGCTGTFKE
jgi:hypothetical protein